MSNNNDAPPAHEGSDEKHHEHHHEVEISINGKQFRLHEGPVGVIHLKHLAGIPHEDVLGKEVGGKFHPFAQDGEAHIRSGEVLLSHPHEITIWIDKQKFEIHEHELTVAKLLELAGDDPQQTTLELKEGNKLEEFTDLNKVLCLRNGMRFVVFHKEPTPVS
jgi:hypothetical protein